MKVEPSRIYVKSADRLPLKTREKRHLKNKFHTISCCVAVAVGDLGSDLDSELCQSDDCAAKQARTGLAAANDDDLQDPNTITNHLPENVRVFWLSNTHGEETKIGIAESNGGILEAGSFHAHTWAVRKKSSTEAVVTVTLDKASKFLAGESKVPLQMTRTRTRTRTRRMMPTTPLCESAEGAASITSSMERQTTSPKGGPESCCQGPRESTMHALF